jgi:hypothetical protein
MNAFVCLLDSSVTVSLRRGTRLRSPCTTAASHNLVTLHGHVSALAAHGDNKASLTLPFDVFDWEAQV